MGINCKRSLFFTEKDAKIAPKPMLINNVITITTGNRNRL